MLNSTKIDESSFVQNIHSSAAGDQIIVDEPTKSIELPIVDEPTNDTHNSKHENIYKYAFHFYSLQTINNN